MKGRGWNRTLGVLLAWGLGTLGALRAQTVYTTAEMADPLDEDGHSPRAAALGSAFAAVDGDLADLYFNPAGLAGVLEDQVSLAHQEWIAGISQDTLSGAIPLPPFGTVGLGINYVAFGSLQGYDPLGDPTSSYDPERFSFQIGWAEEVLPSLALGLSADRFYQAIAPGESNSSSGFAVGLLWKLLPTLRIGTYYSTPSLDDISFGYWKFGASWDASFSGEPVLFLLDMSLPSYGVYQLQTGLEKPLFGNLFARLGYQVDFLYNNIPGFHGLTAGFGADLGDWDIEYSFAPEGALGSSQLFGLSYRFSNGPGPTPTPTPSPRSRALPSLPLPNSPASVPAGVDLNELNGDTDEGYRPPTVASPPTQAGTPPGPANAPVVNFQPANGTTSQDQVVPVQMHFQLGASSPAASPTPLPSDLADSIRSQIQVVQQDPSNAQAWVLLGNLYWKANQPGYTLQCFQQALKIEPDNRALSQWIQQYQALQAPLP